MPELPEVETTLRGLIPHIKEQTIKKVIIREYSLRWPIPRNIHRLLQDKTIIDLERRGKYLLFKTGEGTLIIHLGMSGNLRILLQNHPPHPHAHVDLLFSNKKILRFTDPRRFGAFLWANDSSSHPLLKNLGIEPLVKDFSGQYLWLKSRNKKIAIKSFLMNSKIVTGIGNIYAAETLFAAKIHPAISVNLLRKEHFEKLVREAKKILRQAIKRGGTTFRNFISSEGKPGYFANRLKVYGRSGLPCVVCLQLLQSIKISQRSTVYCKRCQRLDASLS